MKKIIVSLLLVLSMLYCPIDVVNKCIYITSEAATQSSTMKKPDFSVNSGNKQVTLSWNEINGAKEYWVYCYDENKKVSLNSTKKTSYTVKNLDNKTKYKFLVRAVNGDKKSDYSDNDWIYATPNGGKVTSLDAPKISLSQSKSEDYTINVKWNRVANADSYSIYYKEKGEKEYTKVKNTTGSSCKITLEYIPFPKDIKYIVGVRAVCKDENGNTVKSDFVTSKMSVKDPEMTPSEFSKFMNNKFSSETYTSMFGEITVSCSSGKSVTGVQMFPYDVRINIYSDAMSTSLFDYQFGNRSKKEKEIARQNLAYVQYVTYYWAERLMPGKKIQGGFYREWYKYPNLKLDLQSIQALTWVNYSSKNSYSFKYSDTKYTGKMKWDTSLDDYDLSLTPSLIEKLKKEYGD